MVVARPLFDNEQTLAVGVRYRCLVYRIRRRTGFVVFERVSDAVERASHIVDFVPELSHLSRKFLVVAPARFLALPWRAAAHAAGAARTGTADRRPSCRPSSVRTGCRRPPPGPPPPPIISSCALRGHLFAVALAFFALLGALLSDLLDSLAEGLLLAAFLGRYPPIRQRLQVSSAIRSALVGPLRKLPSEKDFINGRSARDAGPENCAVFG